MSDSSEKEKGNDAAPKKGKKGLLIIASIIMLAGGAAGLGVAGFSFYKSRSGDTPAEGTQKAKADGHDAETGDEHVKQVLELQPFIINLADSDEPRYLRMTISLGLAEEEEGAKPDPLFTTKVRNAMLNVLSTKRSTDILTIEGKATLRSELLTAARSAASKPQVSAIYITDFIVQL